MSDILVQYKLLDSEARVPLLVREGDSGYSLFCLEEGYIDPLTVKAINTGVALKVPHGYECQVRSRSGLAYNNSVFVLNSPGTIDSNYTGEIKIILANFSSISRFEFPKHSALAQLVFCAVPKVTWVETTELDKTNRNAAALGSSGLTLIQQTNLKQDE